MKFLLSIFTLAILTGSCNSKKEAVSTSDEAEQMVASKPGRETSNSKSDIVQDNYKKFMVIYETSTRGAFKHIGISKSEITISKDRNLKEIDTFECKPKDWKELNELLSNSLVENLDLLEAPTQKRLHDGAPHATLSVVKGDVVMMTPTFDHGYPPKEIETLVNKVLSMAENATKQ
jgi:hypothetical protein